MAKKFNRNRIKTKRVSPEVAVQNAYRKGFEEGYNAGYKEGGEECIKIARHVAVLPLYNIVHEFVQSGRRQNMMVKQYAEEQNRIYVDEFFGDRDKVIIAMEGVKRIYKEVGLTGDEYDVARDLGGDGEDNG